MKQEVDSKDKMMHVEMSDLLFSETEMSYLQLNQCV